MVGAYCASSSSSSLLTPPTATAATTKLLKPPHSTSNSTPLLPRRKLTRRKNHLRPKILKTLPKPLILSQPPQTNPVIPIISSPENDTVLNSPTVKTGGIVPAVEEFEEAQFSATEGVAATQYDAVSGNSISSNSFLLIGLGLVGVFVLQTISAVWILGKANDYEKDKNLNVSEKNVNGVNNGKLLANDDVVCLDKKKLEYRINEIRAIAREARKNEAEIVDQDASSSGRIGIGKEVRAKLVKMENVLGMRNGKLPGWKLNDLEKYEDDEEAKEMDEKLMFKKKLKFRGPSSIGSRSDVKGFGSDDCNAYEKKKRGLAGPREKISGTVDVEKNESAAMITNLKGMRNDVEGLEKVRREMEVGNTSTSGNVQGTSQRRSSVEVTKLRQSTDLGMQNLQKCTEEKQETAAKSDREALIGRNNGSKHSLLGNKSDVKSDLWWRKLPYVLAILMRRGPKHEEAGFFTLRSTSHAHDQSQTPYTVAFDTPYTVAFENHGDANNFCFLLDSYFEDLGDFNADIVPLPVKELYDAVKSNTKKVIVVKKGHLKLYAGQPFTDVEMALHSLIE